jgi:protein-S-isoprenylcysteine O-methyltransferase Ste14
MNDLVDRLAAWSNRSPFTSLDLGMFRLIFASMMLVLLPNYLWIDQFDPAFYRPAPGPFELLSAFPPTWALATLDVLIAVALALLLVGWRTLPVSIVLSGLLLVGEGFAYSFGKIDHSILLVLTPLFLGVAGWGNSLSLDARRRVGPPLVNHSAMRAFAVAIGVAFVTAGVAKAVGGWLSLSDQATYSFAVQRVERGRVEWLAPFAAEVRLPPAWELLDWTTVALECGLILCALDWRAWRLGLCAATSFHVGVLLVLNIDFWMNMLAYGAFVPWSAAALRWATPRQTQRRTGRPAAPAAFVVPAFALAAGCFVVVHVHGPLTESLGWVPVMAGLVIVIIALTTKVALAVKSSRSSDRIRQPSLSQ